MISKSLLVLTLCQLALTAYASVEEKPKEEVATKFGVIRADCFDKFTQLDFFSDTSCIVFSIRKLVGYAIIGGSLILKLPQIINILKAGSTKGIPASSYYFETLVFLNTLSNARHQGLAFSDYGENAIIIVQNFVVILLIYKYDTTINSFEKLAFVAFFSVYAFFLLDATMVHPDAWVFIAGSCIFMNCASRIPQITSNFSNKSTGVLSFVTFFLSWAGAMARTIGVLLASDDTLYRLQFVVSAGLNTIIITQFFLYWNSNKVSDVKEESKKKR